MLQILISIPVTPIKRTNLPKHSILKAPHDLYEITFMNDFGEKVDLHSLTTIRLPAKQEEEVIKVITVSSEKATYEEK